MHLKCTLCEKVAEMRLSEVKNSGWLNEDHYESYGVTWHIMLCPEHNVLGGYEKAVATRRERYKRQIAEERFPDWH